MSEDMYRRIMALEQEVGALASTIRQESRINRDQQEAIARHINSVSRNQKRSDLPMVFLAGTFLSFMVILASLEISSDGFAFSPRDTITGLIAVPGLVGAIATILLPLIQGLLKKYNLESGDVVTLPSNPSKPISD